MSLEILVDFLNVTIVVSAAYALSSLGVVLGGKSGVFNVAGEGIMFTCASVGFFGTYYSGSIGIGILLAVLAGGLFGLAHSYLTITRLMDQFVVALSFFFMGTGLATLIWKLSIGVTLKPPMVTPLEKVPIPLFSEIPVVGVIFKQNVLVYFYLIVAIAMYFVLYKTTVGLKILSVGENPGAADSLGVNVFKIRYACTTVGGMLIGLAGAYLPLALTGTFSDGMIGGRGWLAVALAFVGGWTPQFVILGSLLFAGIEALVFKVLMLHLGIPYQFLRTLPYIVTIIIMIFLYRRAMLPGSLGKNYDREKRD